MHQHTFRANGIERMLRKAETLGIARFKSHREFAVAQTAICFGDQALTEINSGDAPVRADLSGELKSVGARATSDVQNVRSAFKPKPVDQRRFPGDDPSGGTG